MRRYEDTHLDDGMRHGGLIPSREERVHQRAIDTLTADRDEAREQVQVLRGFVSDLMQLASEVSALSNDAIERWCKDILTATEPKP